VRRREAGKDPQVPPPVADQDELGAGAAGSPGPCRQWAVVRQTPGPPSCRSSPLGEDRPPCARAFTSSNIASAAGATRPSFAPPVDPPDPG
jgi:hypothetical protein